MIHGSDIAIELREWSLLTTGWQALTSFCNFPFFWLVSDYVVAIFRVCFLLIICWNIDLFTSFSWKDFLLYWACKFLLLLMSIRRHNISNCPGAHNEPPMNLSHLICSASLLKIIIRSIPNVKVLARYNSISEFWIT